MSETDQAQTPVDDARPDEPPAPAAVAPEPPTVALPVAILVVAGAVVVALLLVAAVIRLTTPQLPTATPRDPPAPPAEPTTMAISTSKVSFQEFEMTLPQQPFSCLGDQPSPTPAFSQYTYCYAVVHKDFDGKGSSWVSVVGVGLVADSVGGRGDVAGTTRAVFEAVTAYDYQPGEVDSLSNKAFEPWGSLGAPDGKAYLQQADVNLSVKGLATPYDRLSTIVVELEGGKRVAIVADVPHDAGKAAIDSLTTAISGARAVP